jgi:putative ABC transport system permease protein
MVMTLHRKALRTMRENKAQYLGAFFMVLISSMLLVGMTLVADNLEIIFNGFSTNNRLGDAEFVVSSDLDISSLEEQTNTSIEKSSVADYELPPGQTLRIFAANEKLNRHAVMEGNDLDENSILIDPLFARTNELKIGDSMTIAGKEYSVAGTVALPNYIYVIRSTEEMINDPTKFGIAVLSRSNIAALSGASDFYAVRFQDRANFHEQELSFRSQLLAEGIDISRWESTENKSMVTFVTLEITTLSTMSKVVPGMLLILSVILIGILLKRMIQRETAVLGTLYALGYRRSELVRHYLLFPLVVAGAGGFLGTLLGMAMVKPMLNFLLSVFPMPVSAYQYNYSFLIIGLLLPVVVLCLTSYLVIVRLLRVSPADLMKGSRVSEKTNFIERSLKLDRFSFNTKFQIREQVRSLSRTAFLLFGVIVATILLLYGLTMQSSLDYMLNEGIAALYNLKFEYVFNELQTSSPPEGFEQFNGIYVTPDQDTSANFAMMGVLPESTRLRLEGTSGDKLIPDRVIITKILADKLNVGIGDELHVTSDEDLQEYTLTIEAVADSAAGEFIFMPLTDLNQMLGVPANTYIGIWGDEPLAFPESVISSTKDMDAIAAGIRNLISQSGVMVYTLIIMSFILGLIIIFLATGMIIDESRNTISLLKIVGYRPNEVNKLILNSNTIVVIIGYLIGIPVLLISVTAFMQSLTESMQMTIPTRLNGWYMLFGFFIVMLTYQIAKMLSRRKINRIAMSEALKAGTE